MAKQQDPLAPTFDFHPFRATWTLPARVITEGWRTFASTDEDKVPGQVVALLKIAGVSSVSLNRTRVVILRDPDTEWDAITPLVRDVLTNRFVGAAPYEPPSESDDSDDSDAPTDEPAAA